MDVGTINRAIISGSWSNDDLASMIDAVKFARSRLATQAKFTMKVGTKVRVNHQKTQGQIGVVRHIKIKKADVDFNGRVYSVPLSMLEAV
jgi:hypothetical protein